MTTTSRLCILLTLVLGSACGKVSEEPDGGAGPEGIPDQVLQGQMFGQEWTFGWGVRDAQPDALGRLLVSLRPDSTSPCSGPASPDLRLEGSVPPEVGEWPFSVNVNYVSFKDYDAFQFLPAYEGVLRIDEMTDTTLSGGVIAIDTESGSDLRGTFSAAICP